jgi:membrane glycosyltransferase
MADEVNASRTVPRCILAVLTFVTTFAASWIYYQIILDRAGFVWASILTSLFAALFVWIAFSFWMATAGFVRLLFRKQVISNQTKRFEEFSPTARTAILMPIYNESPHRVFAGVRAIYESLQATGCGSLCDFFILSDTTNPDVWLAEEAAWSRMVSSVSGDAHIYYRHRPKNIARKSGNIADFCVRWGSDYRYMIVLDADSVMSGRTIVELIHRMELDSELGILQAPPVPVNRWSLFARCQQFAATVYSPVFLEGFQWWTGNEGNYWGHNAIIRVSAFIRACGLPKLSGDGPLGGEILSHDFVEAALIRRAGYKVSLAADLDGSFEECPPTLITYAQRDQRWCQGNLQHIRLIGSAGLHPVSRLHLIMGAMSYLASPLWLLSLSLSLLTLAWQEDRTPGVGAFDLTTMPTTFEVGLFIATMTMLLVPKLWGYLSFVMERERGVKTGGAFRSFVSLLIETVVSVLVAPVMMAFHTTFVVTTLLGQRVQWNAQERNENGQDWLPAIAVHWKQTAVGIAAGVAIAMLAPGLLPWLSPILAGLILAIPLSIVLSSTAVGKFLARLGLLTTPEEVAAPEVLKRHRHFLAIDPPRDLAQPKSLFRRVLADPAMLALHCCVLESTDSCVPASVEAIERTQRQLLAGGPEHVSTENRKIVLSDPTALKALHLLVWTTRATPDFNGNSTTSSLDGSLVAAGSKLA